MPNAPQSNPDRPTVADPYFIPAGSGTHHALFPGVELNVTAGRGVMLSVVEFQPGGVVPEHSHPHEQMGYLVSGRLEFTVGGLTRVLEPGDLWRIPGGVPHRVVAVDGPAVALDVFNPIREDYLADPSPCPSCGTILEGKGQPCWHCGAGR
jgi:quercetin dioxygenase-like cupin family protein